MRTSLVRNYFQLPPFESFLKCHQLLDSPRPPTPPPPPPPQKTTGGVSSVASAATAAARLSRREVTVRNDDCALALPVSDVCARRWANKRQPMSSDTKQIQSFAGPPSILISDTVVRDLSTEWEDFVGDNSSLMEACYSVSLAFVTASLPCGHLNLD